MLLTLSRPALIESSKDRVEAEYRAMRWLHHRLLDFEDEHQRVLDSVAETVAPGIVRIGRIVARLARRVRRRERASAGTWTPDPRPDLAKLLRERLDKLRKIRNADPRWKAACKWADEPVGDAKQVRRRLAKPPEKVKRRKRETDEAFRERFERLTQNESDEHYSARIANVPRRSRREQYRAELYAQRRVFWATWNALCKSVDQARQAVLELRKKGLPAKWHRPRYRDPQSICAEEGGLRIIERGREAEGHASPDWWIIEMRLGIAEGKNAEWARVRAKCGSWHEIGEKTNILTAKLTRCKDGERWVYRLSLAIDGVEKKMQAVFSESGEVALDWGHREHGHPLERRGIRAFTWRGDDGRTGEIIIPAECRNLLDEIDDLRSRVDTAYATRRAAQKLPERNRYVYRKRLMLSGVRTAEQALWLHWEMRYERRIMKRQKRFQNLRLNKYLEEVRELRKYYKLFKFEDETGMGHRRLDTEEQTRHRKRSNRDLTARYDFISICERYGAEIMKVPARNSTRECPEPGCDGLLAENGPELIVICPKCGTARDKDHGAARVILQRTG
jgi:hypothetical protein